MQIVAKYGPVIQRISGKKGQQLPKETKTGKTNDITVASDHFKQLTNTVTNSERCALEEVCRNQVTDSELQMYPVLLASFL